MAVTHEKEFLFILGSARIGGNTELLARHAAGALPESVRTAWLRLIDHALPLFEDIRHHETLRYRIKSDNEQMLLDATLACTDLVIASPVYWYNVSAATKLYIDHWSAWMRLEGVDFRSRMAGKTLWAVSSLSDEDPSGAQPLVDCLRMTAEYMNMGWGGALIGYGNRPGDALHHQPSMDRAARFFANGRGRE